VFKPFYVHINRGPGKLAYCRLRGATVKVSPADNPRECVVQTTFCSKRDQFCKKMGRSQAEEAPPQVINIRKLARYLATIDYLVTEGLKADPTPLPGESFDDSAQEYFYVFKYMV
jgi:hypothetical protein